MTDKTSAIEPKKDEHSCSPTICVACKEEEKPKVVCEVCGYANPQYTALCKNCSNYLMR